MEEFITIGLKKNYLETFFIWSSHEFFKNNKDIIFEADDFGFRFIVPSIDNQLKTTAVCKNGISCHAMTITSGFIKHGKYQIDLEESNEDQLIVNY